jgi:hypothetical protein
LATGAAGAQVTAVEINDVTLPDNMRRAVALTVPIPPPCGEGRPALAGRGGGI